MPRGLDCGLSDSSGPHTVDVHALCVSVRSMGTTMSSPRCHSRHRAPRRLAKPVTVLTGAAVAGLVVASLSGVEAPASALLVSATPGQIAAAIATPTVTVNGADYVNRQDGRANGISSTPMAGFPTAGTTFGVL